MQTEYPLQPLRRVPSSAAILHASPWRVLFRSVNSVSFIYSSNRGAPGAVHGQQPPRKSTSIAPLVDSGGDNIASANDLKGRAPPLPRIRTCREMRCIYSTVDVCIDCESLYIQA